MISAFEEFRTDLLKSIRGQVFTNDFCSPYENVLSNKDISKVLGKKVSFLKNSNKLISPGLLKRHYSPGIPIRLNCKKMDDKAALIVFGKKYKNNKYTFNLSKSGDMKEAARNLYKTLRKIKNLGFKKINVVKIPNNKIGIAINDRLKKAAY